MPLLLFLHFFNLLVFEAFDLFACCCLGARTEVVALMWPSLGWLGGDHHRAHSHRRCQGPKPAAPPQRRSMCCPLTPPPQSHVCLGSILNNYLKDRKQAVPKYKIGGTALGCWDPTRPPNSQAMWSCQALIRGPFALPVVSARLLQHHPGVPGSGVGPILTSGV